MHIFECLAHLIHPQASSFWCNPICYGNHPVFHQELWWVQKDHPAMTSSIFSSALLIKSTLQQAKRTTVGYTGISSTFSLNFQQQNNPEIKSLSIIYGETAVIFSEFLGFILR